MACSMIVSRFRGTNSLLAAVQVSFAQPNYTITEGGTVNITLVTSTSNYMFDFSVTLQYMDGSATGESSKCSEYIRSLIMIW